jgi:uncharacterized protein
VKLVAHGDAREFLAAAGPLLARDEARHNLMFAVTSTLIASPEVYPEYHLWTVENDGQTVAAVTLTRPFNLVIAQPLTESALPFAACSLAREGLQSPGVVGAVPEVDVFAHEWAREANVGLRVRMRQGVYAARSTRAPRDVDGELRLADRSDRELIVEWLHAFHAEALPHDAPTLDAAQLVDRRLAIPTGGFALWDVGGAVTSLSGYGGRTPNGTRIGPVYTPPDLRRRGYAGALVAALTQRLLDGGLQHCFLYTDLSNPTSNRVYTGVGYELVCESVDYAFD